MLNIDRQSSQVYHPISGSPTLYKYTIKPEITSSVPSVYIDTDTSDINSQSCTTSQDGGSGSALGLPSQVLWALGHNPEAISKTTSLEAISKGTDMEAISQGTGSFIILQPPEDHEDSELELSDQLAATENSDTFTQPSTTAGSCAPHTDTPKPHKGKRHILCPCCDTKISCSGSVLQDEAVLGAHLITYHKMNKDFAVRFVMRRRLIERMIATRGPLLCTMCREPMGEEEMMSCFTRGAPGKTYRENDCHQRASSMQRVGNQWDGLFYAPCIGNQWGDLFYAPCVGNQW